jgi:hypothetical protein
MRDRMDDMAAVKHEERCSPPVRENDILYYLSHFLLKMPRAKIPSRRHTAFHTAFYFDPLRCQQKSKEKKNEK